MRLAKNPDHGLSQKILKHSRGRYRMNFSGDKLLLEGCSKVPVNVPRLECSRSRRSALVLRDLLVSETSLLAGFFCSLPTSSQPCS